MRKRVLDTAVKRFRAGWSIEHVAGMIYGRADCNESFVKIREAVEKAIRHTFNQSIADGGKGKK